MVDCLIMAFPTFALLKHFAFNSSLFPATLLFPDKVHHIQGCSSIPQSRISYYFKVIMCLFSVGFLVHLQQNPIFLLSDWRQCQNRCVAGARATTALSTQDIPNPHCSPSITNKLLSRSTTVSLQQTTYRVLSFVRVQQSIQINPF